MLEQIVTLLEKILATLNTFQVPPAPNQHQQVAQTVIESEKPPADPFAAASADPFANPGKIAAAEPLSEPLTREMVGKALVDLATAKGRDAAVAALAAAQATELKNVPVDKYPVIMAAVAKLRA